MSDSGHPSTASDGVTSLSSKTPFLGQKLYVIVSITVATVTAILLLIFLFFLHKHKSKRRRTTHDVVKEEIETNTNCLDQHQKVSKTLMSMFKLDNDDADVDDGVKTIIKVIETNKNDDDNWGSNVSGTGTGTGSGSGTSGSVDTSSSMCVENMSNIGWGRWFNLKELEIATDGFATENVIGEGGYGVVYKGVLHDGLSVAVKSLLDNRGQAEKEFKVEVEAIGKVRHKNLVGLIGFCVEGAKRMLVYEFVDNGNLEQWLHGDEGPTSTLTWDIRMKIAIGTAKGLAYLHEGLEPKVVHRDVKSSNILLDKKWNAKVADFGLAKLLESEKSYVTTRVMGTFGYVSPDYASTGMLNEGSDVYSFGVLLMELITGRSIIDYSRPPREMNLVDWFKGMVASRKEEELLDPKIDLRPSPRALKRALLVCLRCIDMDASKRPKMGQVIHMLEADEFSFRGEPQPLRGASIPRPDATTATKVSFPIPVVGYQQR
ncbi:probable receptor-like serine/threonine-protein kinase At4g34500 [Rutidosis leptorrhynchoides]|uniref:probable receptor-like serine/threonine-protein kinase At4g34500 n=1 Tax=Rutidosis leptorrhynchoides TaxID=125765 RepID=UPI003A999373